MGFHFTKYGDGVNGGEIQFGVDKFDYIYDDDTFATEAEEDIDLILLENGDVYYIIRQTTTEDSMGNVIDVEHTDIRIYGMFQDITLKDRKIADMGLAVQGNRKFYFKPNYPITSGGVTTYYELKEGDIITDANLYTGNGNTGQFRVIKIIKQWYLPGNEVYRIAIVQSINLDGTA